MALGVIRIIVENKNHIKLRDLINYAVSLYINQGFKFENKLLQKELSEFLMDRLKFYMKEEKIRNDIIQASINTHNLDQLVIIFEKANYLNKIISTSNGFELISSYKRASNILESELKGQKFDLSNTTDPGIFKTDFEKNLFEKINDLRKYFFSINKDEVYSQTLDNLLDSKKAINDFLDNVIVNDADPGIRKNRLELIQILCKTFNKYVNFSLVDSQK